MLSLLRLFPNCHPQRSYFVFVLDCFFLKSTRMGIIDMIPCGKNVFFFFFFMLMQNSFFYYPEKKKIPTFWACENAVKNTFKIFKCICNLILQPNIQFVFNVAYHFWCDITENLLIKASSLMHTLPLWPMSSLKPFELRLNWIPLVVSVTACQFCVSWMEILL